MYGLILGPIPRGPITLNMQMGFNERDTLPSEVLLGDHDDQLLHRAIVTGGLALPPLLRDFLQYQLNSPSATFHFVLKCKLKLNSWNPWQPYDSCKIPVLHFLKPSAPVVFVLSR